MGAKPGPKPRPTLSVVREGNPGKRPIKEGLKLPPETPKEPTWTDWFQVTNGAKAEENQRCRDVAKATWAEVVPVLSRQGLLAKVDLLVLVDLCVCVARLRQCERLTSTEGIAVWGARGMVTNPAVNAAAKYRQQLKTYVAELGLSPSSRTRLEGKGPDGEEESPFDV